jgi:hypothetical protein
MIDYRAFFDELEKIGGLARYLRKAIPKDPRLQRRVQVHEMGKANWPMFSKAREFATAISAEERRSGLRKSLAKGDTPFSRWVGEAKSLKS